MKSDGLLELFRKEVNDLRDPPLWTDDEVYSYMDDAQKMFCRLGGGIADSSTPEITIVSATEDEEFSDIDPRILKIRSARRASDQRRVDILNFEDLESMNPIDDYGIQHNFTLTSRSGPITAMVVGMEQDRVRWISIPQADEDILLIVYRLPLETISKEGQNLEIQEQHHRHLMHWMKALAYQKQDAETFDRGKAAEFESRYLTYVRQANEERGRREHKYRTVGYGGIL